MSAFSKKYSDEQVHVIVSAILDGVEGQPGSGPQGKGTPALDQPMTAREAVKAAAEGRLPGLPAFPFNLSSARNYAQLERRDRAGKTPNRLDRKQPDEISAAFYRRAIRAAESTARRIEANISKGKGSERDANALLDLAAKVDKLSKQRMTRPASSAPPGGGQAGGDQDVGATTREPQDFAAQLAAQSRATTAPSDQTPQNTQSTERPPTPGPEIDREPEREEKENEDRFLVGVESSSPAPSRLAAAQALLSAGG
ncbi:hypothetical protein DSM104299_03185 [Baekduia alba]|uniref:hypothetical protein n=1 Tax=Baekduia alba TaxID=2997333 RepID=UPI00234025D8|nr:hypothetical protein [Baekduia alba]WCB94448.1 hypothetical protein DSM104299_03185 [Baekduia alba]